MEGEVGAWKSRELERERKWEWKWEVGEVGSGWVGRAVESESGKSGQLESSGSRENTESLSSFPGA